MTGISQELLTKIAERAGDPRRRTADASLAADAQPLDLAALMADFQKHGAPGAQGLLGGFSKLLGGAGGLQQALGGMVMAGPGGAYRVGDARAETAPATPPTDDAIKAAEAKIGRQLPVELRQLYALGDGGFGPANGLFPIAEMTERYAELVAEPFGPAGQDWPANLLPLFDYDPQWLCLNLDDGRVICWDPEEIEDEDSAEDWDRSFVPEADSLAALMERWLDEPTTAERMEQSHMDMANHVPQATIDFYAAMTPAERAEHDLHGDDWLEQLRARFASAWTR